MQPTTIIILLTSLLCMVYLTDAEVSIIQMKYDKNGKPYIIYGAKKYACDRTRTKKYRDSSGCEVELEIIRPTEEQIRQRRGYIYVYRICT
ncbi:unnamed protein product [Dicrocoelium dendriticum]|nr:unnamed protein product [Dicrocoelium dendriticum]